MNTMIQLGKGVSGAVYPGELLDEKKSLLFQVAVKQFSSLEFSNAIHEILINLRIYESHQNVVNLPAVQFDLDPTTKQIFMVRLLYQKIDGKNLKDFIKDSLVSYQKKNTSEIKKIFKGIFQQAVQGINHLHKAGIIHSDIKHQNFMIEEDK